jgi:hypothetical protein
LLVFSAAGAGAATQTLKPTAPSAAKSGAASPALTFDLRRLRDRNIRGVVLRLDRRGFRLGAARARVAARTTGRMRVRLGRPIPAASARKARLVITYRVQRVRTLSAASAARTKPGKLKHTIVEPVPTEPAPAPAPEPAPAPAPAPEPAPAPAPAPSGPVSWTCGFTGFKAGSWPTGCWRPYADTSPFNRVIPANAPSHPNSANIVRRVLGFGAIGNLVAGEADSGSDWNHPTYYSTSTDPIFTLHCYEDWGTCDVEGMKIRIPDAARPAAGGDAHLTVVDQASGWEYDLYKVRSKPAGGGVLEFRWGGRTRIDGMGTDSDATAARFGNLAGIIRAQEMETSKIAHALFMNASCDSGTYVYPARKTGRPCTAIGQSNTDAPPMGARLQLAMSIDQINALPVPPWKKTILRAMSEYGMYMGDTGGGFGVSFESGSTYTSFGVEDQMVKFARENNVPTYNGKYVFNLRDGVDWARYLRVVDPCTASGTCA